MAIYGELSASKPDAFLPDLACSLAVLANCLDEVDEKAGALDTNKEAISKLKPGFLTHPAGFAHWMVPMCKQYIERCEALGQEPDAALLAPIIEKFQALEDS